MQEKVDSCLSNDITVNGKKLLKSTVKKKISNNSKQIKLSEFKKILFYINFILVSFFVLNARKSGFMPFPKPSQ